MGIQLVCRRYGADHRRPRYGDTRRRIRIGGPDRDLVKLAAHRVGAWAAIESPSVDSHRGRIMPPALLTP